MREICTSGSVGGLGGQPPRPTRHSYKIMEPATPLRAFFNRHISDRYSGEVHLERVDRQRILAHLAERGVSMTRTG